MTSIADVIATALIVFVALTGLGIYATRHGSLPPR